MGPGCQRRILGATLNGLSVTANKVSIVFSAATRFWFALHACALCLLQGNDVQMARYLVLAVLPPLHPYALRCNAASRTSSFEKPARLAAPEARIRATPPHINRRPTKLWLRMPARSVVHVTCKRCDIVHCRRAASNGSSSPVILPARHSMRYRGRWACLQLPTTTSVTRSSVAGVN
jgi:hypothetical protein